MQTVTMAAVTVVYLMEDVRKTGTADKIRYVIYYCKFYFVLDTLDIKYEMYFISWNYFPWLLIQIWWGPHAAPTLKTGGVDYPPFALWKLPSRPANWGGEKKS